MASICSQAPTWTLCEAPTSRAPTLSCQGTNLEFRSTNSQDTNPFSYEAPTSRAPTLYCNCLDLFGCNSLLPTLLDLWLTSVLLFLPFLPELQIPLFSYSLPVTLNFPCSLFYIPDTPNLWLPFSAGSSASSTLTRSSSFLCAHPSSSSVSSNPLIHTGHVNVEERLYYNNIAY